MTEAALEKEWIAQGCCQSFKAWLVREVSNLRRELDDLKAYSDERDQLHRKAVEALVRSQKEKA